MNGCEVGLLIYGDTDASLDGFVRARARAGGMVMMELWGGVLR